MAAVEHNVVCEPMGHESEMMTNDKHGPDGKIVQNANESENSGSLTMENEHRPKTGDWLGSLKKFVFVLGTALLVFVAARNSITWHVQQTWGASGDLWQRCFDTMYYWCGSDDFNLGVYGSFVVVTSTFWIGNAFFIFMDLTGRPACLLRYKVQPTTNRPLNRARFWKAVKVVLINQFCVSLPVTYVYYYMATARGCSLSGELPTFHWVLLELIVYSLIEEVGFYYTHRLSHHPRLYKHIHKMHHEWPASISIIGIYCHPIEHLVSNLTPLLIGPLIMGSHVATYWLWLVLATLNTTISHSGYHLPFLTSPEAHDFHHLKFNQNFGTLGVLDRLHGTDEIFRAAPEYQRHIMLLNLTSARELFPDVKKAEARKLAKTE